MIPEIPYGAKPPPKLLWSPMIETPEDEGKLVFMLMGSFTVK